MCPTTELDLVLEAYGKSLSEFKGKDLGCRCICAASPIRIDKDHVHFSD